jgi:hypothetical protein
MLTCDPSVPPPGLSRLLALPRELRDIIYDFAITEDEGMMLVERHDPNMSARSFKGCTKNDPTWEANQLKYASKQLYAETKGLGLGLNDLSIQSEQQIADFAVFIATCSTGQQKRIRRVTLSSDDTFPAASELWGDRDDHIEYVREELRKWYYHGY